MDVVTFENLCVVGLARVDAPVVMSSAEVEARLQESMQRAGWPKGLIYQLTGIRARRLWSRDQAPSDAATLAGRKVLDEAGISSEEIGLLISTSVSKDFVEPSVASLVHRNLGMGAGTLNFDVGNACLGFLNGIQIAGDMIERGHLKLAMVVAGESSREVLEATMARFNEPGYSPLKMRKELATLTLGSGAAAMILGRADEFEGPRITGCVTRAATDQNHLCRGQATWMQTDAANLLIKGVELGQTTFGAARKFLGWSSSNIDAVAAHQVSAVHIARISEALGVERERFVNIYEEYGNVGPVSIPIALDLLKESGAAVPSGRRVAMMGIGSGLNCSMMELVF